MDDMRLGIGLLAFCIGLVVWLNLTVLLTGNTYQQYPPNGGQLATSIFVEIIVALLIFGGLILMYLGLRTPSKPKMAK